MTDDNVQRKKSDKRPHECTRLELSILLSRYGDPEVVNDPNAIVSAYATAKTTTTGLDVTTIGMITKLVYSSLGLRVCDNRYGVVETMTTDGTKAGEDARRQFLAASNSHDDDKHFKSTASSLSVVVTTLMSSHLARWALELLGFLVSEAFSTGVISASPDECTLDDVSAYMVSRDSDLVLSSMLMGASKLLKKLADMHARLTWNDRHGDENACDCGITMAKLCIPQPPHKLNHCVPKLDVWGVCTSRFLSGNIGCGVIRFLGIATR